MNPGFLDAAVRKKATASSVILTSVFTLIATSLLALGIFGTTGAVSIREEGYKSPLKFAALSVAASHQELDLYLTAKLFDGVSGQIPIGLVEPFVTGESEVKGLLPLKFQTSHPSYTIGIRPYLSASGLLAEVAYLFKSISSGIGLSSKSILVLIYSMNLTLNVLFVFLLTVFIKKRLQNRLATFVMITLILSPWIILDSLSLMLSPAIRFGGLFTLCLIDKFQSITTRKWAFHLLFASGVFLSSLNGFEFFFFDLVICLLLIRQIYPKLPSIQVLIKYFVGASTGILFSLIAWFYVLVKNVGDMSESLMIMAFTFFKHSLLRGDFVPAGGVASGDSNLPIFKGLIKMLLGMSLYIPYPFPESAAEILRISNTQIQIATVITSAAPIIAIIIMSLKKLIFKKYMLSCLILFSMVGVAINSYIYNHPHHMPPVVIMLTLVLTTFQKREVPLE